MSVGVLKNEYSLGINFSFPVACLNSEHPELRKVNKTSNTNILNFLKSGNYEIILRRWPSESGLHLNDSINTFIPSTKNWDELSYGKKLEIESY